MKTREEHIQFEMNYCQHYEHGDGADMICTAGMDLNTVKRVPTGIRGIKWGPCIEGHTLANPLEHCPHWIRRTREQGEKRADEIEKSLRQMELVDPVVSEWRKKQPKGKQEIIECPVCHGRLHLSQSSYNGHVWGMCETEGCVYGWSKTMNTSCANCENQWECTWQHTDHGCRYWIPERTYGPLRALVAVTVGWIVLSAVIFGLLQLWK